MKSRRKAVPKIEAKKYLLFIPAILLVICLWCGIAFTIAAHPTPKILQKHDSEEALLNELDKMSFDELIDEINELGDDYAYEGLSGYAHALYGKLYDVSVDTITNLVISKCSTENLKCLILDLCSDEMKPIRLDYNKLISELLNTSNTADFRSSILLYLNQYDTYADEDGFTDILAELTADADDTVSSFALQALYYSDAERAMPIIDSIFYAGNTNNKTFTEIRALDLKADSLWKNKDPAEISRFLTECDLRVQNEQNALSVLYAVIDVHSVDTMLYVLNCSIAPETMKLYCVYHNYSCLSEWFFAEPISVERVEKMIQYLDYYPAKQAIPDLQKALDENPAFFSENPDLKEKTELVEKKIEKEGGDAFGAWQ